MVDWGQLTAIAHLAPPWYANGWLWLALAMGALLPSFLNLWRRLKALSQEKKELTEALEQGREEWERNRLVAERVENRHREERQARQQAQEEHRKLEEKVLQTQKLESLGVLAGRIAHDFNNLLMGIGGSARLAMGDVPEGTKALRFLDNIVGATDRAADLCRQMLAYSAKGRPMRDILDLNSVSAEIRSLMEISVAKKIELRTDFEPGLPACAADAAQIRQMVMNLIMNGAESIGDREGVVTLSTSSVAEVPRPDGQWIDPMARDQDSPLGAGDFPGPFVCLGITDTGEGMDRQLALRIFDPSFSTKDGGRGLGLAAVAGIVRAHGGAIRLRGKAGEGMQIRVFFPALEPATAAAGQTMELPFLGEIPTGSVLLVDDEETVREVASEMLSRAGFEVLTAADGREAVELYRLRHAEISCVLLDLTMPRMDGVETLQRLQDIAPEGKVILSSGYSAQEVPESLNAEKLAGFLQKPYDDVDMVNTVRQVIAGAN